MEKHFKRIESDYILNSEPLFFIKEPVIVIPKTGSYFLNNKEIFLLKGTVLPVKPLP